MDFDWKRGAHEFEYVIIGFGRAVGYGEGGVVGYDGEGVCVLLFWGVVGCTRNKHIRIR